MINDGQEPEEKRGAPAWMATFADLMSLLVVFFVLLLSFSEMDVQKYKQIAGSMKMAFGVQRDMPLEDIPMGTSIVAQEFSPGKTEPTPLETIRQVTEETREPSLRVGDPSAEETRSELSAEEARALLEEKVQALLLETEADAEKLREILADEVQTDKVDIETDGRSIIVRIRENGSFPSGSATLNSDFLPVMARLREALSEIPGTIAVEGHTDDVPVRGGRFESNWDLSANRALSVTHELLRGDLLANERMMLVGYAETRPFTENDSPEGRAMNRRVELVIRQGLDDSREENLEAVREASSDVMQVLGLD
jgi:chemotaxis protein MotB